MSVIPTNPDGPEIRVIVWGGVPDDGTSGTYAGLVLPGQLLIDTAHTNLYINTNTTASPTWKLIAHA